MVFGLAKKGCGDGDVALERASERLAVPVSRGWKVRHHLVANDAGSALIAEHLVARKPFQGIVEEITIAGSNTALSDRLVAAGWRVRHIAQREADFPTFQVESPSGHVVWHGGFNVEELRQGRGVLLDDVLLSKLLTGEQWHGETVPYGCAPKARTF